MKQLLKTTLLSICILAASSTFAQKVGYLNFQELVQDMPEIKGVKLKMDSLSMQYEETIKMMNEEYKKKMTEYEMNKEKWTPNIKALKEKDIMDLQGKLESIQQTAQEDLQGQQKKLLEPVVKKAKEVVAIVAKEGGYSTVIDSSAEILIYTNPADDLLPAVRKKMGLGAGSPK